MGLFCFALALKTDTYQFYVKFEFQFVGISHLSRKAINENNDWSNKWEDIIFATENVSYYSYNNNMPCKTATPYHIYQ